MRTPGGDLAQVAKTVGDLDVPDRQAADLLAPQIAARAPRATGHLAGSVVPQVGYVAVTASYAPFVHDGTRHMPARPFAEQAAETTDWPGPYLDHLAKALDGLQPTYTLHV